MDQKKPSSQTTVSTSEAAELLMVSDEWVRTLNKMGYLHKLRRGKWSLTEVVQGYIRFLKDEGRRSNKNALQSRLNDIKAERLEMLMKTERKELIPFDHAQMVLDTAADLLSPTLVALPAEFTGDIQERKRLEGLIETSLQTVADGIQTKLNALKSGSEVTKYT